MALHRTLLHEHHGFFLATQYPSAGLALIKARCEIFDAGQNVEARYSCLFGSVASEVATLTGPHAGFHIHGLLYDGFTL